MATENGDPSEKSARLLAKARPIQILAGALLGGAAMLMVQCAGEERAAAEAKQFADQVALAVYGQVLWDPVEVSRERVESGEVRLHTECPIYYEGDPEQLKRAMKLTKLADEGLEVRVAATMVTADPLPRVETRLLSLQPDPDGRYPCLSPEKLKPGDIVTVTWNKMLPAAKLVETRQYREFP